MSKEILEQLENSIEAVKKGEGDAVVMDLDSANQIVEIIKGTLPDENLDQQIKGEDVEAEEIKTVTAQSIFEDLKDRRQKAKQGDAFGKPIPQVELDVKDVEKAMDDLSFIAEADYLERYGFLTNIYLNAAKRTGKDIEKYRNGLFVKFD